MSGEGNSQLFVRTASEEDSGRLSVATSMSSLREEETNEIDNVVVDAAYETAYNSLTVPSKSKKKIGKCCFVFLFTCHA